MSYDLGNVYLNLNKLSFTENVFGGKKEHEVDLFSVSNTINLAPLDFKNTDQANIVAEAYNKNEITIKSFANAVVSILTVMDDTHTEYVSRILDDELHLCFDNREKSFVYFTLPYNTDKIIFTVNIDENKNVTYNVGNFIPENVIAKMINTVVGIEEEGYTKPCVIEHLMDLKTQVDSTLATLLNLRDVDTKVVISADCEKLVELETVEDNTSTEENTETTDTTTDENI